MSEKHIGYDLNVWDKGSHNGGESQWVISVHYMVEQYGQMSTGDWIEDIEFVFTPEEAKQLTLGVAESDGGLYDCDEDFFIQSEMFLETYGDAVPERVRKFVEQYVLEEVNG